MSKERNFQLLDRHTEIGGLSLRVRDAIKRLLVPLTVALVLEMCFLWLTGRTGAAAFTLIAVGAWISLVVWCSGAIGLPLLPVLAVQSLVIYGAPIMAGHSVIDSYPPSFLVGAGEEVLIFNVAMAVAWWVGMQLFHPSPPISYALREVNKAGAKGWGRLGFGMIIGSTLFETMQSLNLTDSLTRILPLGSSSILAALVAVVSASGFFLVSMTVGSPDASTVAKTLFWVLLVVNGMLAASEFLLYSVAANLVTVAIGFFWGSGRLPWKYLILSMLFLSFLNMGKTTMRERYWSTDYGAAPPATLGKLPSLYAEWIQVSYNAIIQNETNQKLGRDEKTTITSKTRLF